MMGKYREEGPSDLFALALLVFGSWVAVVLMIIISVHIIRWAV